VNCWKLMRQTWHFLLSICNLNVEQQ
jgi:hypothetical protein